MKKTKLLLYLLLVNILFILSACSNKNDDDKISSNINIVTSFYPIYLITQEIVKDVPNISLNNMANPSTGCLHDYQLTTSDMKKLTNTDLFIINGGDMEGFIDEIENSIDSIEIIDTSINTNMIEVDEHSHSHNDEHNHFHDEHDYLHSDKHGYNAHIWLSPDNAAIQAENIYKALSIKDPKNEKIYKRNLNKFYDDIYIFKDTTKDINFNKKNAAIFHEGYIYFAKQYGFNIDAEIYIDENIQPSTKILAHTIDDINKNNINILLCANDESLKIAQTVANETGAKIYILNPLTYENNSNERYIDIMYKNAHIIEEAFK